MEKVDCHKEVMRRWSHPGLDSAEFSRVFFLNFLGWTISAQISDVITFSINSSPIVLDNTARILVSMKYLLINDRKLKFAHE